MDEIIYWFKRITNITKAAIFIAAAIIAALPFIDIGTKILWITILGLILSVIARREAAKFMSKYTSKIILGYVFWVILIWAIAEVVIPLLQSS